MSAPTTAQIPVYISRHTTPLPDGYGAFIGWQTGERCRVVSVMGRPTADATLLSGDLKWHEDAPEIDSARGKGKWVLEVQLDLENSPRAVPASQVIFGLLPRSE